MSEIASLQRKTNELYLEHPELEVLDGATAEFGATIAGANTADDKTVAEKQELLLASFPTLFEAYNGLVELLGLDVPQIDPSSYGKLDTTEVTKRKPVVDDLAARFHFLVVKHLVVIEKFTTMVESESSFWADVEKRLNDMNAKILKAEKTRDYASKY